MCGDNGKINIKKWQCSHHLYTNAKVPKSTRYLAYEAEVFLFGSETITCMFCFCIQTPALNSISSRVLVPKL